MGIPIQNFFIKNDIRQEQKGIPGLALDIKAQSLLQPIIVQKDSSGDYEILDGRRRFYAMRDYLKYSELEETKHFLVREGMHALAVQYAANENREDFTPIEKASLINAIHEEGIREKGLPLKGAKTGGWTLADTAKIVNREKGYVSRMLQIHNNADRFKECSNIQECLNVLQRDKQKKFLSKVTKAKIARIKTLDDLGEVFKTVKCASAQDFLPTLKTASIDLIHTDPPFAIQYDSLITTDQYDVPYEDDPDTIMAIILSLISEFYRVLKNDRYCIIWCDYEKSYHIRQEMIKVGFSVLPSPIVWTKLSTAGKTHQPNIRLGNAVQFALVGWKGMPELSIKGRHNYFPYPIVRKNRIHQAQMPEDLVIDLLRIFSAEGDLILDCFAGSLTTLRACYMTERRFIGCELQEENIENGISYSMGWINEREKAQ